MFHWSFVRGLGFLLSHIKIKELSHFLSILKDLLGLQGYLLLNVYIRNFVNDKEQLYNSKKKLLYRIRNQTTERQHTRNVEIKIREMTKISNTYNSHGMWSWPSEFPTPSNMLYHHIDGVSVFRNAV